MTETATTKARVTIRVATKDPAKKIARQRLSVLEFAKAPGRPRVCCPSGPAGARACACRRRTSPAPAQERGAGTITSQAVPASVRGT